MTANSVSSGADRRTRVVPGWLAPAIVGAVVLVDQLTKAWVVANLTNDPLSIIGNDVELRVGRNSGVAFSLFTNATVVLALLAIVMSVILIRAVRRATDLLTVVALSLVLGGALGNLCDRLFRSPGVLHGGVVDFVRVGSFPTFNVADSAITIGALLLVYAVLRGSSASAHRD
ncbi:MAG TPA: signal peptidase II [Acidimicrobiia bacterium]